MWRVTAQGAITGSTFVYEVDAPPDARVQDVLIAVYGTHGTKLRNREVDEPLMPGPVVESNV